ncbi:MAG: DEAD/DEAH box helicase family protein [Cetobacterium sp.]
MKKKVLVVDSICGSGKSSALIRHMKENNNESYIYVTPFLDEVDRVVSELAGYIDFEKPINKGNGKIENLKHILGRGKSVATTHMLFSYFDEEVIELIKLYGYNLILDEVAEVVSVFNMEEKDVKGALELGIIEIDESGYVCYNEESKYIEKSNTGLYGDLVAMAKNNRLISYGSSATLLLWHFPIEVLQAFKTATVLTYMFEYQLQSYYFRMHGVEVEKKSAMLVDGRYSVVDYYKSDISNLRDLIKIHQDKVGSKLNVVGNDKFALSKNWFENGSKAYKKVVSDNSYTWIRHRIKVASSDVVWTCFKNKKDKPIISITGHSKRWIGCNARATNSYRNTVACAYLVNRFVNPILYNFFKIRGMELNQEGFALSEMIQLIFRTRLREDLPIDLYIPSRRMRMILENFLQGLPLDDGFDEIFRLNMYKK